MTYPYRMMPLIRPWADAEPALRAGPLAGAAGNLTAQKGDAMSLALSSYSYPLLGAFWTIFMIFLWVIWIWILVRVFIDIFRSRDLSGWAKALWFLFVLFIPIIGVVVYLIARGDSMNERTAQQAQQQDQEFRSYVQEAAADSLASTADQLAKLADLRDRGVISAGEFESQKAKVLAA
jgi:putative oligomerization/nucleic acid binding protein/phospholipase D-like protein